MVQKLNRLIGRADFRVLVFITMLAVLVTIGWAYAQLADDTNTINSYEELVAEYLAYRENNYMLAVPSWYLYADQVEAIESTYGLAGFQNQEDWYFNFNVGERYYTTNSPLAGIVPHGIELIIYEDMISGELRVVRDTGTKYEEEIVYKSPEWPEISKSDSDAHYLFKELSKRRVVWHVTLKNIAIAEEEMKALQAAQEEEYEGGGMMMLMGGGEDLFISSLRRTNGMAVTISYPSDFTNRLDVFTCTDLNEEIWQLAVGPINATGTTSTTTTDTNVWPGPSWRMYTAGNADLDTDGDGFSDVREALMYRTDYENAASHPVSVSGSVSYGGPETGTVYMVAVNAYESWSMGLSTAIPQPGGFTNNAIALEGQYWFKAFRDVNGNYIWDSWEPWGRYSTNAYSVTGNVASINITISNTPSIWGTIAYAGSATGDIYVITVTNIQQWTNTYQVMISWQQGMSETGNPIYVSFPVNYGIVEVPTTSIWIKAFIDSDGNSQFSPGELSGFFSLSGIQVSNRLTGINITLGLEADSDGDWFSDHYELLMLSNPFNSSNYPALTTFMPGNLTHPTSTVVSVDLSPFIAEAVMLSDRMDFIGATTSSFNHALSYQLGTSDNGWRVIYMKLIRSNEVSRIFQSAFHLDTEPPDLLIEEPVSGLITSARWVRISGQVQDQGLGVSVQIDGKHADGRGGGTFDFYRHRLEPGTNVIVVTATDRAGHIATGQVSVVQDTSLINAPPAVGLFVPEVVGSNDMYHFEGFIDDPYAQVTITVRYGEEIISSSLAGGLDTNIWASLTLWPGTNEISVMAENVAGYISTSIYEVVRTDDYFVIITNPTPNKILNSTGVVVRGYVSLNFVGATITVNGVHANITQKQDRIEFATVTAIPISKGRNVLQGRIVMGEEEFSLLSGNPNSDIEFVQPVYGYEVTYVRRLIHSERENRGQYEVWPGRTIYYRSWRQESSYSIWDASRLTSKSVSRTNITYEFDTFVGTPQWTTSIVAGAITVTTNQTVPSFAGFGDVVWSLYKPNINTEIDTTTYENEDSEVRFIKHSPSSDPQYVLLSLPGGYNQCNGTQCASNVYFRGHQGFMWNNYITFLYVIEPNVEYRITKDDFEVPVTYSYETNSPILGGYTQGTHHKNSLIPNLIRNDVITVQLESDQAANSPKIFKTGKTDPESPCGKQPAEAEALVIYYNEVFDYDTEQIDDFDITLKVSPTAYPGVTWSKISGPTSGSLIDSNQAVATYQNPKVGGVYQFEAMFSNVVTRSQLLLPLGGPDVTDYFISEAARYDAWLTNLHQRIAGLSEFSRGMLVGTYGYKTVKYMNHKNVHYSIDEIPCEEYADRTVTLCGYVLGRAQLGNILFGYVAARAGANLTQTYLAGKIAAMLDQKSGDLPEDQEAYQAGFSFGQSQESSFCDILELKDLETMQSDSEASGTPPAKIGWPTDVEWPVQNWDTFSTWGGASAGLGGSGHPD